MLRVWAIPLLVALPFAAATHPLGGIDEPLAASIILLPSGGMHTLRVTVTDAAPDAGPLEATVTVNGDAIALSSATNETASAGTARFFSPTECHEVHVDASDGAGNTLSNHLSFGACTELPDGAETYAIPRLASGFQTAYVASLEVYGVGLSILSASEAEPLDASFEPPATTQNIFTAPTFQTARADEHDAPYCGAITVSTQTLGAAPAFYWAQLTTDGSHCHDDDEAPAVDVGEDQWKLPAQPFTLTVNISDDDASHDVTIDWGDGTSEAHHQEGGSNDYTHKFLGRGNWTVTACATDSDGQTTCDELSVTQRGALGQLDQAHHPGKGKAKGLPEP